MSLQQVIVDASLRCLDAPLDRVDEAIGVSLREMGQAVGADRAYCFDYDFDGYTCRNTHEWCQEGISPQMHTMQALPLAEIELCVAAHRRGESLAVADVATMPDDSFKVLLLEQEIRSLLVVPMLDDDAPVGFVGFDFVRRERQTSAEERGLLQVFAQLLVNIRRRQREQAALSRSEQRLRTLVESFPNGVMLLYGRDLRFRTCGGAGLAKLDLVPDDLLGHSVEEVLPRSIRARARVLCAQVFEGHEGHEVLRLGDRAYECWTRPVKGASAEIEAGVVFVVDVTERLELQSQLTHAQKMESVGRLAGGVAHDFNNMLGVIIGHVELLLEDAAAGSELLEDLQQIQRAAQRSAELTRQLLAFARKQAVSPRVLDLNESVGQGLKMLRRLIGPEIELAWQPGRAQPSIRIDPGQLEQLLANVLVNARDAIDTRGTITVTTNTIDATEAQCRRHEGCSEGRYAVLTISDNGHGMSEEVKRQVFEPFFTTKAVGEGTGLGLSTVYGIMRQNDGFVSAQSEPGQGSTFELYFRVAG
jgi:signal transduction histidine kinase